MADQTTEDVAPYGWTWITADGALAWSLLAPAGQWTDDLRPATREEMEACNAE